MKPKDLNIQTCKFVDITDIVPKEWQGWFYCAISENAPFSWGDNNRTMVDALSFRVHADDVLEIAKDDDEIAKSIEKYGDMFFDILSYLESKKIYIDLEN